MMNFDFKDKIAIVTGGNRGIGKAISEALLCLDCRVIITSTGNCPDWCKKYRCCEHRRIDFLDPISVENFSDEIISMVSIDILVNNAGIQIPQPVYELNEEDWDKVLKINLYGPMQMTRAVTPKMKVSAKGRVLNISSIAGIISKPGQSAYSASKAGLIGLTRSSALDMAPYNVLINALCPGPTSTDMVENLLTESQKKAIKDNIPLGRFARVEEIANYALFLCSDLNTYITGQTIIVDGGALAQ
jgi:3-oxoacyl-[acyl-carrier protein] reductase